jgi:hypothetical protein
MPMRSRSFEYGLLTEHNGVGRDAIFGPSERYDE